MAPPPPADEPAETIWYEAPRAFFAPDALARFVPVPNTPLANQLNALVRLALYAAAVLCVLWRSLAPVYLPLVAAAVTALVWRADSGAREQAAARLEKMSVEVEPPLAAGGAPRLCTAPTLDNPFMNVLVTDYTDDPARPRACSLSRPDVAARAEAAFGYDLYRPSEDVFDRVTTSRQFYATPSTTIPNDQGTFARWLYEQRGPTLKELHQGYSWEGPSGVTASALM